MPLALGCAVLTLAVPAAASAAVPFTTTTVPAVSAPTTVAAGDLDQDGKVDLVGSAEISAEVRTYLGDGTGSVFTAALGSPFAVPGGSRRIAVADLDGNSFPDLILPRYNDGGLDILLGNGSGFTAAPSAPLTTSTNPYQPVVADFNGDGKPDIALTHATDTIVDVWLGNGDGTFNAAAPVALGTRQWSLVAADLNGDGKVDLVTNEPDTNAVAVLLGAGDGTFSVTNYPFSVLQQSVAIADFTGDGRPDIASTQFNPGTVNVLPGNGDGTFGAASSAGIPNFASLAVSADFNADDRPDLAVQHTIGGGKVSVLAGDGAGGFSLDGTFTTGNAPSGLITADVNGDRRPDLVSANYGVNTFSVLRDDATPAGAISAAQPFGEITVGHTAEQTITVTSSGTAALHAGVASVSGTGFSILHDHCTSTIVISTCTLDVRFSPTAGGAATGTLTVPSDDGAKTVSLSGTGTTAAPVTPEPPVTNAPEPPTASPPVATPPVAPVATPDRCESRRTITITLPPRLRGKAVTVTVNGKRIARVARAGKTYPVSLAGLPKGIAHVKFASRSASESRTYLTCTPRAS